MPVAGGHLYPYITMGENSLPMLPVPLKDMTRDSLRMFIPRLLNHGVDGIKAKIGSDKAKPPSWWPEQVPFNNVRSDTRSEALKSKMSWTEALRHVVRSCYQYYGGEDLLIPKGDPPDSPIKVINNVDGSVSFITDKAVVTLDQRDKSKFVSGLQARLENSSLPTESSAVPVPSRVFQNLQGSTSNKASVEIFICYFCEKQFKHKSDLHGHQSCCSMRPRQIKNLTRKRKLKLIPVDEIPRADKKNFIAGLNLIPLSTARIMKKQRNKSKDIEITKLDDEEGMKSPNTPKTPKSLISQLSRDLSPPGRNNRRKSLMSAFEYGEEVEQANDGIKGIESATSEAQKAETEGKDEALGNRSLLSIDVCSNLGNRVRKLMHQQAQQSLSSLYGDGQVNYEQFCHTPKKNEALARLRIRNSDNIVTFRKTRKTCPKHAHQYKFNPSQRKEWYLRNVTGLNARGRELKKLLKKCSVRVQRLSKEKVEKYCARQRRNVSVNISKLSELQRTVFADKKSAQSLLTGRIFTSPDGKQFLVPMNIANGGPRVVLPHIIMPQQQRMILPKPALNNVVKGQGQGNLIHLTPPATPDGKSPRPIQLLDHLGRQNSMELQKLLQRPLKQRLDPYQKKKTVKRPYKAVSKVSPKSKSSNNSDVICLSSDDECESSASKPPPAKRQKVESKSNRTLLFKCHLCHAELTCQNNFAKYIESHFATKHNVNNIQLVEHVDNKGQTVVSIVEKVAIKKMDKNKAAVSGNLPGKMQINGSSLSAQKSGKVLKNNVKNRNSSPVQSAVNKTTNNGRRRNRNGPEVICID